MPQQLQAVNSSSINMQVRTAFMAQIIERAEKHFKSWLVSIEKQSQPTPAPAYILPL